MQGCSGNQAISIASELVPFENSNSQIPVSRGLEEKMKVVNRRKRSTLDVL